MFRSPFVRASLVGLCFLVFIFPATSPLAGATASVASGFWSDASIWSTGVVPGEGDDVRIRPRHVVTYDVESSAGIRVLWINGRLEFSREVDTQLEVGLVLVTNDTEVDPTNACAHAAVVPGRRAALRIGSRSRPIPHPQKAVVRLRYFDDLDAECAPGLVNRGGHVEMHGAPLRRTWTKLGAPAEPGATELTLAEAVDWRPGDRLIVTATDTQNDGRHPDDTILDGTLVPQTEERLLIGTSPNGTRLAIDAPLVYEHQGGASARDYRGEVANLSRNVVVESADPDGVRGHTMFHNGSTGSISYAEFRHLGKAGVLGRYPLHFHIVGDSMRGSYVDGASIWDSHNRWITIHGTEYAVIRNTVGFGSLGHGFFLENGAEVYNLFQNNLGVQAYMWEPIAGQALEWDLNDGACYWAANARNFAIDNVFVECDNADSFILDYAPNDAEMPTNVLMPDGSRQVVDVSRLSGGLARGLEVHSHWGWGPWIRGGTFPEDEPMRFEDVRVWNTHYSIDISGTNVVFDGVEIHDSSYGFYNNYPGSALVRNVYINDVGVHGAFMHYLGGGGTLLYENLVVEEAELVFRMNAKREEGDDGMPIDIHARNVTLVDPDFRNPPTAWVGTEDDNVRADPRLMLVVHDLFAPNVDGVFLPEKQSPDLPGVPPGLEFADADGVEGPNGALLEGRGDIQYATGDLAWPDSALAHPVDRIPPATTILRPQAGEAIDRDRGPMRVCGVSVDQFGVAAVRVNGVPATLRSDGVTWCADLVDLPLGQVTLTARSIDAAGNAEMTPHTIIVRSESGVREN